MGVGYYYVRGLKVVPDNYWCNWNMKYMPKPDESKRAECTFKTAVESVANSSIEKLLG